MTIGHSRDFKTFYIAVIAFTQIDYLIICHDVRSDTLPINKMVSLSSSCMIKMNG